MFAYAWEHSQLGLSVHCVGNSIYANASACAESVSEGCHLFDTVLLLLLLLCSKTDALESRWIDFEPSFIFTNQTSKKRQPEPGS